jgi:hypothetical protein
MAKPKMKCWVCLKRPCQGGWGLCRTCQNEWVNNPVMTSPAELDLAMWAAVKSRELNIATAKTHVDQLLLTLEVTGAGIPCVDPTVGPCIHCARIDAARRWLRHTKVVTNE